jgi:hypothetical protein
MSGTPGSKQQSSRIYVGGVANTAQTKDLEEIFSKHGKILGKL